MDMVNLIRVAIADDHPMIRVGGRRTLERDEQFRVVAEAPDGKALLSMVRTSQPDVLLLDIEMPDGPIVRLIPQVRLCSPATRIVILSAHTEARYLQPLRELDVSGFIVKDEAPERLLQAVRVVHGGESWFSHAASRAFSGMAQADRTNPNGKLTRREQQIFELMQLALDNATIAEQLNLSKQTVRRYATIIYEKLGVKNRIQAIVEADKALREPAPMSLN